MTLGWKTALVAVLAVLVIGLNIWARRKRYERFREEHTRRKYRIPQDEADQS